jgi:hypothetical protein
MYFKHPPFTAAKAVRALLADSIATTWDAYFDGNHTANAHNATKLVQEQCNGPGKSGPVSFLQASRAVSAVMPNYSPNIGMASQGILDKPNSRGGDRPSPKGEGRDHRSGGHWHQRLPTFAELSYGFQKKTKPKPRSQRG